MLAGDKNAVGVAAPHGVIGYDNNLPENDSSRGELVQSLIEHSPALDAGELQDEIRELVFSGEVSLPKIRNHLMAAYFKSDGDPQYWAEILHPLTKKLFDAAVADAIAAGITLDSCSGYELAHASDLARESQPPAWAIKGVLPARGVGAVYGASMRISRHRDR